MNPRIRGLIILVGFLVFAVIFCGIVPFVIMPGNGVGAALPVIEVPGEVVVEDFLPGFNLTNTIIGTLITDLIILLMVFLLWRMSRGWTKEIPGRLQGMFEAFVSGFRNFMLNLGGDRLRTTPLLWPLVATIFLFLLTANYMKLLPGVETVGKMHCAYPGQSGYAMLPGWTDSSYRLWVDQVFDAGTPQSEETQALCYNYFVYGEFDRFEAESADAIAIQLDEAEQARVPYEQELNATTTELATLFEDAGDDASAWTDEQRDSITAAEEASAEAQKAFEKAERAVIRQQIRLEAAEQIPVLEARLESLEAQIDAAEDPAALEAERDAAEDLLNFHRTQMHFPTATLVFTEEQLDTDAVPFIFHITPFVRGPATDLSLTVALAIFSIVIVQIYGVMALGPAYFEKFINLSALGNLGKKPMGVIDFVVGLIEIISEIGKIVSLAFRLFGNLFAGGVALMVVSFLVSLFVPGIIFGLELIIGAVQALVFAVLTLVFSVQAMESHHGDDHDGHEHEAAH